MNFQLRIINKNYKYIFVSVADTKAYKLTKLA